MRLLIILFLLLPTLLFSQDYHVRGCDSRFYKTKTYRVLTGEGVVEDKSCVERRRWPDGKYYFYYDTDTDTFLQKPYIYQVFKNGSSTYRKKVGNRKEEVSREFAYLGYYENGVLKSEEGSDSGAFDWRRNLNRYYDSSGNLYWKWRLSLKGIDEHGNVLENTELLILNKGDTVSYTLSYGTGEHAYNGYYYSTTKIKENDTITKKQIIEKQITHIDRGTNNFFDHYWLDDTITFRYSEKGEVISKTQSIFASSHIYKKNVSYINDSLVYYHFELTQDFNFNDSDCNYAEFHSNGMPKYLRMSYCQQDRLITKYDSTGEETYREEFFVIKDNRTNRLTYLYKPNRERYLIKKEVCKRKRCKYWLYNENGELVKVKRYRKKGSIIKYQYSQ